MVVTNTDIKGFLCVEIEVLYILIRITMIYDQCNIIHVALNETKFKKKMPE